MKKINIILFSLLAIMFIGFVACDDDEDEIEVAEKGSLYPMSGDWFVTYKIDTSSTATPQLVDVYDLGWADHRYSNLYVYNTSKNNNKSFWIDDDGNFWTFKVKVDLNSINESGGNFSVTEGYELYYEDTTTVTNGKVVNMDSIYMEIEWISDPGTIYYCSGRRFNGFRDDYE